MKNFKNYTLLILLASALSACGSKKFDKSSNSTDLPSRSSSQGSGGLNGKLSDCNGFNYPSQELSGLVTTYYENNGFSQTINPEKMRMRIIDYPQIINSSNDYKLEMYLWGEDTPGHVITRKTTVEFFMMDINNGTYLQDGFQNKIFRELSKPVIEQEIDKKHGNNSGVSISEFLNGHILILKDVSMEYDAISLALYKRSGGSALNIANFLIPQFYANPNVYINTHFVSQLQEIHPNYPEKNQSLSEEAYFAKTETYCSMFKEQAPGF